MGIFSQDGVEVFAGQRQQDAGRDRADGDVGRLVGDEVGLAEEFALGQQGNPQVAAVDALAQDFDLSLGDDEELAQVLSLDEQLVAQGDVFGFEAAGHAGDDRLGQLGKERHAAERFRRERRRLARNVDADAFGLGQLDLGPVDAVGSTVNLHPRQEAQEPPRGDRHHLRRRLRRVRQVLGDRRRHATLQQTIRHGVS